MEPPQQLYDQSATHFRLRLYLRGESEVHGRLVLDLAEFFLSNLLFPGTHLKALNTKRPGMGYRLNMGAFTASRWKAAQKKILSGDYAVLGLDAETPDFPNQKIRFNSHVNPPGRDELLTAGTIEVMCSVSYLRHIAATPAKVEALLEFARRAWNGVDGGPAYGYGHLAISLPRPLFDPFKPRPPDAPMPWDYIKPPDKRVHAVPIAYVGSDIELNLEQDYVKGRGIKGAFWANFLNARHVEMAGGESHIREKLEGLGIERLGHDGLLIVATDSPLPDDTQETRERFLHLHAALQPAFLSRDESTDFRKPMLSYFYRERSSVIP